MKEVVIIGSGNLAEALARTVAGSATLRLRQIWARNAARGEAISRLTGAPRSSEPDRLAQAECYLLAVSDRAVGEVAARLPIPPDAAVVHTAGAVSMDTLPFARRGVLYPLQTFTAGREVDFRRVPLFVEASSPDLLAELEEAAGALSDTVLRAGSAERAPAASGRRVRLQLRKPPLCAGRRSARPDGPAVRRAEAPDPRDRRKGPRRRIARRSADGPGSAGRPRNIGAATSK